MFIPLLTSAISKIGILLVSFYIIIKSINYNIFINKKIFLFLWCLLWTILNIFTPLWFSLLLFNMVYCAVTIIFVWIFLKINLDNSASAYMFSYGLSYSLYFISNLLVGLILNLFLGNEYYNDSVVDFNNPVYILAYTITVGLQFFIAYRFFKIKRFKNGFPFLLKRYAVIITLIAAGNVVVIAYLMSEPRETYDYSYIIFMSGIFIIGAGTIIWIIRGIRMFYISRMKERGIEQLEQELLEIKAENQRLTEQNELLRVVNHKVAHRLSALEYSAVGIIKLIKNGKSSAEISEKFAAAFEDIMRLRQDYENDISKIKRAKPLPSTKINGLDNMFRYFLKEYENNNIDFNLKVNGSIPYLVENIINQSKLETLIGDLLQNALIAVNASDKTFRNVLAIIGLSGDCYEFTVFDSGIPFEPETLALLGKERVTTHADIGGSGIGFMTAFETMKECGASLIINEKPPSEYNYTKSVTVKFDGRNQYLIESYRSGDIMQNDEKYITEKT